MRRPIVCLLVAVFAALVGPRLVGPQNRSAGEPFAYEPPEGFVLSKAPSTEDPTAKVWVHEASAANQGAFFAHPPPDPPRVVLTHSAKEMSVEETDLAKLAEEMPKAFEGLCAWTHRRHEMRVRADRARVGLIEGDCDRSTDRGAFGLPPTITKARKLQLMFPDDQGTWIATASYAADEANRWEPLFEATIGKAKGVAVRVPPPPAWMYGVCAALGGVLAWFATALFARGRSSEEQGA